MQLLLLSATASEISKTEIWLNNRPSMPKVQKPELLIGGIGQMQTAYSLQKKLGGWKPELVIQAGIGGAPSQEYTGKVFAIRSESLADLGALEKTGFKNLFQMGLQEPDQFPFHQGKLPNPYNSILEWTNLPLLDGVTVNEIKETDLAVMQRNVVPFVESMEGAAMHYVCLMEKIPFLQIRSISNIIGNRDKSRWKIEEAVENLHSALVTLIQKFENVDKTLFRV